MNMKILQILIVGLGLSLFVNAQNEIKSTILTGTVFDRTGAVIPVVVIKFKSESGKIYQTKVDITSKNKSLFYEITLRQAFII